MLTEKPKDYLVLIDKYIKTTLMEDEGESFRRAVSNMRWQDALRLMGYKVEEDSDYQDKEVVIEAPIPGITITIHGAKVKGEDAKDRYKVTSRHLEIQNFNAYLAWLKLGRPLKLPYTQEIKKRRR